VVVFYLNFAIARMIIISFKASFDILLSCLNHFPLFAVMLRIKDPRRLPGEDFFTCVHVWLGRKADIETSGGIRFELRDTYPHENRNPKTDALNEPLTSVIYLKVRSHLCWFRVMSF